VLSGVAGNLPYLANLSRKIFSKVMVWTLPFTIRLQRARMENKNFIQIQWGVHNEEY
jgi:hypothetical protein